MPTALVTGSPDRVPDIAIALKSAGYDILAAGPISAEDVLDLDLDPNTVDCYVQLPGDSAPPAGQALDLIASEVESRFATAARLLPLLAPEASVVLVFDGTDLPDGVRPVRPDQRAARSIAAMLAEAIISDSGRDGVRATVVGGDRSPDDIAALAARRPSEPVPWWFYAGMDPELAFADWRTETLCLASVRDF